MDPQDELERLVARLRQEWEALPEAERAGLTALARRMAGALQTPDDRYAEARRLLHSLRGHPEWRASVGRLEQAAASLLAGLDPFTLEELVDHLRGPGSARKEVR